jgi:diacylglycerol kinase family enzyme
MHDDISDQATETETKARGGLDRADRIRERIRLSQTIAAQRARIEATGGKPSEDEAARMVSEFHARGGQVTICPPPDDSVTDGEPDHGKRR